MEYAEYKHIFNEKPCQDAIDWLETQPDLATAWETCPRGDWLWWALQRSDNTPKKDISVNFAYFCADNAKKYAAYATAAYADAATAADADAAAYAAADAANAAAYADATADADAEKLSQSEWIRKHITCPFQEIEMSKIVNFYKVSPDELEST